MKSGKAPGLDGIPVECLKKGGIGVLELLVRLLNISFDMGAVSMDWPDAGTVIITRAREGSPKVHSAKQKWPRETHSVTYITYDLSPFFTNGKVTNLNVATQEALVC